MTIQALGWGPGPGARLLAPGLPDAVTANGQTIAWVGRQGVYWLKDDRVLLARLGAVSCLSARGSTWMAVVEDGDTACVIVEIDPAAGLLSEVARLPTPARKVLVGGGWWVVKDGTERLTFGPEGPVTLPMGARRGRLAPWADRPGVAWADEDTLYRMEAGGRPQVVGSVPGRVRALVVGPGGAMLATAAPGTWAAAPGASPVLLDEPVLLDKGVALLSARFSPDGARVLAATADGAALFDLCNGEVLRRVEGTLTPAGFAPEPLLLDEERGVLLDFDGNVRWDGFLPTSPACDQRRLVGPGGAAWDLATGRVLFRHPALSAEHIVVTPDLVLCVNGPDVVVLDPRGLPITAWSLPPEVVDADGSPWDCAWADDELLVEGPDGIGRFDIAGRWSGTLTDEPLPDDCAPGSDVPGVDGQATTALGTWSWSDDGELIFEPAA